MIMMILLDGLDMMLMMMMTKTFKDEDRLFWCAIIHGGGYCGGHGRTVNQITHTRQNGDI